MNILPFWIFLKPSFYRTGWSRFQTDESTTQNRHLIQNDVKFQWSVFLDLTILKVFYAIVVLIIITANALLLRSCVWRREKVGQINCSLLSVSQTLEYAYIQCHCNLFCSLRLVFRQYGGFISLDYHVS